MFITNKMGLVDLVVIKGFKSLSRIKYFHKVARVSVFDLLFITVIFVLL